MLEVVPPERAAAMLRANLLADADPTWWQEPPATARAAPDHPAPALPVPALRLRWDPAAHATGTALDLIAQAAA
ncbi:hypothetical protein C3492_05445 [Streptomyces sp. Ru62]|uniref:hypothetical protein n=1 Tax=Streptomyces sp. Ru62 TaxID=2080745 RepID=UPI000CDD7BF5|nr:hypothetical protein [Streptomyces sp. Ru62]POX64478.1 hypothetical protein C3492_05445 [Streptomyces sp. Ru62]